LTVDVISSSASTEIRAYRNGFGMLDPAVLMRDALGHAY
jgi:hypothetical protein